MGPQVVEVLSGLTLTTHKYKKKLVNKCRNNDKTQILFSTHILGTARIQVQALMALKTQSCNQLSDGQIKLVSMFKHHTIKYVGGNFDTRWEQARRFGHITHGTYWMKSCVCLGPGQNAVSETKNACPCRKSNLNCQAIL
jgi:hypothetical protein